MGTSRILSCVYSRSTLIQWYDSDPRLVGDRVTLFKSRPIPVCLSILSFCRLIFDKLSSQVPDPVFRELVIVCFSGFGAVDDPANLNLLP